MATTSTTSFASIAKQLANRTKTWNGALTHATSGSARVDLFYGAVRGVKKTRFFELLRASYDENAIHTLKLVAYVRASRGGKGDRVARSSPATELTHDLQAFIGEYGRFDDPMALMGSPVEAAALELLRVQLVADLAALQSGDATRSVSLCAKWIPSEKKALDKTLAMNKKLSKHLGLSPAALRKVYLSPLRAKLRIVERAMCAKQWDTIAFSRVPSVAMHIHGKPERAFPRHLPDKFAT